MSVFEVRGGNDRRSMIKRYERKSKQHGRGSDGQLKMVCKVQRVRVLEAVSRIAGC